MNNWRLGDMSACLCNLILAAGGRQCQFQTFWPRQPVGSQQRWLQAPDVGLVIAPPVAGCAALGNLRLRLRHIELAGLWCCLQVWVFHRQAPSGGGRLAEAAPDAHQVAALQVAALSEGNSKLRSALSACLTLPRLWM